MNEHTFIFWMTMLGAAVTAVATIGGIWLGAHLALKHQRAAEQRARDADRERDDEDRDRRAASYLLDVVHTCVMALQEGSAAQRADAVRALQVGSLKSDAWELRDRSFVGAVTVASVGYQTAKDDDERWRIVTYLMQLGTQLTNRLSGRPYEVAELDGFVTPEHQPRKDWWPR